MSLRIRFAVALVSLAVLGPATPDAAELALLPRIEVGTVYETNPRYRADCGPQNPEPFCGNDYAMGVYVDAQATGSYRTPKSELRLTPRIRDWNFLDSGDASRIDGGTTNGDLNNNDFYLDGTAMRRFQRGEAGLSASYFNILIRQLVFEDATLTDPNAPPPIIGGSGQVATDGEKQEYVYVDPYVTFQLSERNTLRTSAQYNEVSFDTDANPGFFDFESTSVELLLGHTFDERNTLQVAVTGSKFEASNLDRATGTNVTALTNTTDSYGISAIYLTAFSQRLSGSLRLGTARNTVEIEPEFGGRFRSTETTLVGNLGLRQRSERTTLNFDVGRSQVPRSDGRQINQNQVRLYVDRTFTQRLSGEIGLIAVEQKSIGDLSVFEQRQLTLELSTSYRLAPEWSVRLSGAFNDNSSEFGEFLPGGAGFGQGNVDQENRRLYLSVIYQGTGFRR